MTCIVGLIEDDAVWIGGDSCGSDENSYMIRKDSKVFLHDDFIYGFCSSFRAGQVLKYKFVEPVNDGLDVDEYLHGPWMSELRKTIVENGCLTSDNGIELGSNFMVGYSGRLFIVESDFQIAESVLDFVSIGSGSDFALGSLFTVDERWPAEDKIRTALLAAESFTGTVKSPFVIECLRYDDIYFESDEIEFNEFV